MFLNPTQVNGHIINMIRTDPRHLNSQGRMEPLGPPTEETFSTMVFRAMEGVNADQMTSAQLYQEMILDPDSVDAHDVSIAAAQAQMTLGITKSVIERAVKAYQDIISIR